MRYKNTDIKLSNKLTNYLDTYNNHITRINNRNMDEINVLKGFNGITICLPLVFFLPILNSLKELKLLI